MQNEELDRPEQVGEIDWFQDGEEWVVADVDNGTVYGRYATEAEALAVITEYRWSGRLPEPQATR